MRLYVFLLIATVLGLVMWPDERIAMGFILLGWSWLALMRGLWMLEHVFHPAHKSFAASLPGVLLAAGTAQQGKAEAQKALGGFSMHTVLWLGLGAICVLAGGDYTLPGLAWPCLIALCYLLAQGFAHSRSEGALLAALLSGLFAVMAVLCFITAPAVGFVMPAPAVLILGLFQAYSLLGGLRRERHQMICALAGLAILLLMLGLPVSLFLKPALLCGWAALGALSVQSRPIGIKKSRLRQL